MSELKPHQQRVVDEQVALGERLKKLLAFIDTDIYDNLPEIEKELLYFQSQVMEDYYEVLGQRIELFKGDKAE